MVGFILFALKKTILPCRSKEEWKRDWEMHKKNNSDLNEKTRKVWIQVVWVGSVLASSAHSGSELVFSHVCWEQKLVSTLFVPNTMQKK